MRLTNPAQTLLSSSESNKLGDKAVGNATRGILFMGTPHDGSPLANYGSFFAPLLSIWRPVNPSFLKELSKDNDQLWELEQRFVKLYRGREGKENPIEVRCFFETMPMSGINHLVSVLY
jgi:hypothetical protein